MNIAIDPAIVQWGLDHQLELWIGLTVLLVFLAVAGGSGGGRRRRSQTRPQTVAEPEFNLYPARRIYQTTALTPALAPVPAEATSSTKSDLDRDFDKMVYGTQLDISPVEASLLMVLWGCIAGLATFLFTEDLLITLLAFLGGLVGIFLFFFVLRNQRRKELQSQLPDACFLMVRSLRAGLTVPESIQQLASNLQQPLRGEFARCAEQLRLGMTPATTLQRLAQRTELDDAQALATAVQLHSRVGGELTTLLESLAIGIRDRNQFRAFLASATALGRASAAFVALAPLFIFAFYSLFFPNYLQLFFSDPIGLLIFGVVLILQVIGTLWILWLFRIDY